MEIRRQMLAIIAKNSHRGVSPIDLDFAMRNYSVEYKTLLQTEISQGTITFDYVSTDGNVEERYKLNQRERFSDVVPNAIDEKIYRLHQLLQKNPSGTYLSEIADVLKIPLEQVREMVTLEQVNDYVVESNEDPLHVRYYSNLQIDVENLVCSAKSSTAIVQSNSSIVSQRILYGLSGLGGVGIFVYYLLHSLF